MLWLPTLCLELFFFGALYFWLRRRKSREFASSLIATFIWGICVLIPAMIFETAAFNFISEDKLSVWLLLLSAFVCTALIETVFKFIGLYADTHRSRYYRTRADAVIISVFFFGGFALAETVLQAINPLKGFDWLRYLTVLPLAVCMGALMGCFYGRTKTFDVPYAFNNFCAILLPLLLQGLAETAIGGIIYGYGFGLPLYLGTMLPAVILTAVLLIRMLKRYGSPVQKES